MIISMTLSVAGSVVLYWLLSRAWRRGKWHDARTIAGRRELPEGVYTVPKVYISRAWRFESATDSISEKH